jgi:autoinducer 2 (AI-2) kinase
LTEPYLLAFDAGTSAGRCALFDREGRLVARSYHPWGYTSPPELAPMGKEFDPAAFWDLLAGAARDCLRQAGISAERVAAVSATSQREGMVFLDRAGAAIYAGPNIDLRGLFGGLAIDEAHGAEVFATTGHLPSLLFGPARLAWFRDNAPEAYAAIALVLPIDAWVVHRLCGEAAVSPASANECGLVALETRTYATDLLETLDLRTDFLPPLAETGTLAGRLTEAVAAATGLRPGTPVAVGGPDTQCGLLGMSLTDPGALGIVAGSTMPLQQTVGAPLRHESAALWTGCHVIPDGWVVESGAGDAGHGYAWLAALLSGALLRGAPAPESAYGELEAAAAAVPPGGEGALAFLGPGVMDMSNLKALTGGTLHPVPVGLTGLGAGHLARAALENLAFAMRANADQLAALAGVRAGVAHLCGGLSRSRLLGEIAAAVLERPVRPQEAPEATALGAAIAAAVAAGLYPDLRSAAAAMTRPAAPIEPDPSLAAEYTDHYERWRRAYAMLDGFSGSEF